MEFKEKKSLATRVRLQEGPYEPVAYSLLVGEEAVARWTEAGNHGHEVAKMFPAYYGGEQAWLVRYTWFWSTRSHWGGSEEFVLPFEEGTRLLAKVE